MPSNENLEIIRGQFAVVRAKRRLRKDAAAADLAVDNRATGEVLVELAGRIYESLDVLALTRRSLRDKQRAALYAPLGEAGVLTAIEAAHEALR